MNTLPAIQVENLSKTFRIPHEKINTIKGAFLNVLKKNTFETLHALDNISFEVKKGEFFGIIGRNGSGKSTLLKILAGIYQANSGKISVHGRISPFLELGIGFNPELSGRDNIYLNASVLGLSRRQIDQKFEKIVAFSELERFIDQKIKNYSSGMQVRLAFSVAIHANRDILLMDEVLAVGDSNFQSKCIEEFKKYRKQGKTVILVSHDIQTIQQYCDRALLLRNGKVVYIGKADDVGNEYILQNMSDKEKMISKRVKREDSKPVEADKKKTDVTQPEKKKEEVKQVKKEFLKEFGNMNIVVDKVKVYGKFNKEQRSFSSGDAIKICIHYKVKKDVERPHFGIGVRDSAGTHLISTNHLRNKQIIQKCIAGETGIVECLINKVPLLSGIYHISIYVYGDKYKPNPIAIHHINDAVQIIITNQRTISDDGKIFLDCEWNIQQNNTSIKK